MGWKIMIADDEEPARDELAYLLHQIEGIDWILQVSDGVELLKRLKEREPDVVFLDINMPGLNGLQTAEIVSSMKLSTKVVFSTAFDQYALEAFKLRAFHYVLKPYDFDELSKIFLELDRLQKPARETSLRPLNNTIKLAIETNDSIRYLDLQDIYFISKEGKQLLIHTKEKKYQAEYTLQELEYKLAPFSFFRCHKSYLVNLNFAAELQSWANGSYNLIMSNLPGNRIPVSRNYAKNLRARLEL